MKNINTTGVRRLLLVDQDTVYTSSLSSVLKEHLPGLSVDYTDRVESAKDAIALVPYDLVVADADMPGIEALRSPCIIWIIGQVHETYRDMFRMTGCEGIVSRPYETKHLFALIHEALTPLPVDNQSDFGMLVELLVDRRAGSTR